MSKINIDTLAEIFRMKMQLSCIRDDLHRAAMLTDIAIEKLDRKIMSAKALDDTDWDVFMHNLCVQCMNSKSAKRYDERLIQDERAIWDRLLELCGSDELGKEESNDTSGTA